jgi:tetratricopeptide (TPR) repeat protein
MQFAGASRAQTTEELLQQADAALQKEDYAAAVTPLESYLATEPQNYNARFNLALAYSVVGRQSEAIVQYQQVLAQMPELVPARLNLGILLLQQGSAAAALEQFQRVIEQQPDHWAGQVNRAAALVALNRLPEARQAYEQALRLKPGDAQTHLAYVKVLGPGDPAAERHLRQALQLDPSLEEASLLLASVLEGRAVGESGTLDEAAGIYRKLIEAHPERGDVRLRLGEILLVQGHTEEAVRELEAARAVGAAGPALSDTLLQAYLKTKQTDAALALLPELIAQQENNSELRFLEGTLRMEKRQYAEAAEAFRRAAALDPQSAPAYTNLASALYLLKDYAGTIAALERVAALGKDTAGSYFLRAIALDKLEQKATALENYQRFLAINERKDSDQEFQARQRVRVLEREVRR